MRIIEGAGVWTPLVDGAANDWVEHLRVSALSVGTHCIPAGGLDTQSPHTEDEIYVVTAGRAKIVTPDGTAEVGPGSVIFVPAGEEHRFDEVTETWHCSWCSARHTARARRVGESLLRPDRLKLRVKVRALVP